MKQDNLKQEDTKQENEAQEQTNDFKKPLTSLQEEFERQTRLRILEEEYIWE